MKLTLRRFISCLLILAILAPYRPVSAQDDTPEMKARALAASLSTEEKIGQLFLVTFDGTETTSSSQIYDLVVNRHVGGVVLRLDNNNFIGPESTAQQTRSLVNSLQEQLWESTQLSSATAGKYIPLYIGLAQDGDSYPNDQIINGLTPLPSAMSIGATWNTATAEAVGQIMGQELSALGINFYMGPSLDLLDVSSVSGDDLGVQTFGSDPYWVGKMASAYIRGLHLGSQSKLVVITKHFPGRGGSDRLPEEEVATVRKSLEALKQYDLTPFFTSMSASDDSLEKMDGVLVSHIRYQGLQENIREITPPVSLDAEALKTVLSLEPAADWYAQGGLIVSDSLGSNAVRKFYDPTGATFDARLVARNAFLAGNDLLYLDNFHDPVDNDAYATIVKTLDAFVQKYNEDPAFAERVDQSVIRILTSKYKTYTSFRIDSVQPSDASLNVVGSSQSAVFEVARQSVTLINPSVSELNLSLPRPPESREQITIFTDSIAARQCSVCQTQDVLSTDALKNAIVRLYGPAAGGSVVEGYIHSYTFLDLTTYLNDPEGMAAIAANINDSSWVVFGLTDVTSNRPESQALKRLLAERSDLLRDKKVIVFAFGAPYYLDATDISKITAYYGLYSKISPYVDMAARILFQEITPSGASPVSIPGIGYDIIEVTAPDENQIIPLSLDLPLTTDPDDTTSTPEPTNVPLFNVGDTIPLKTGVIYDHNGNPVPDGTVVQFIISNVSDGGTSQQINTVTTDGIARTSYRITVPTSLEIRVQSEPAIVSQVITLNTSDGQAFISTYIPTLGPTQTPSPSPTITASPTLTPTMSLAENRTTHFGDWFLSNLLLIAGGAVVFWLTRRKYTQRWAMRWSLMAVAGGLIAYLMLTLQWIIPINRFLAGGTTGIIIATLTGFFCGWLVGWVWHVRFPAQPKKRVSAAKSTTTSEH